MINIFSAYQFRLTGDQFDRLHEIITHAYAETEKAMWGDDYVRIDRKDLERCIDRDEVLVALIEGRVVGGVRFFHLRDNTWSFSLLATDFNELEKGIGKALVLRAEEIVQSKGADSLKVEILRPENQKIEAKERIAAWYQRMDYHLVKQIPLGELYPEKVEQISTPSIFDCYLKTF
jgi:GNAT superfamily N-acetyltransferase